MGLVSGSGSGPASRSEISSLGGRTSSSAKDAKKEKIEGVAALLRAPGQDRDLSEGVKRKITSMDSEDLSALAKYVESAVDNRKGISVTPFHQLSEQEQLKTLDDWVNDVNAQEQKRILGQFSEYRYIEEKAKLIIIPFIINNETYS